MRIASVMMLLMWRGTVQATPDSRHAIDWELFSHQPGIYYEKIGQLRQAESAWKLVIKLSAKELEIRHQQLQDYMEETAIQCRKVIGNAQLGCRNIMRIIERKNTKLITLLTQVETLYKTTDKRRRGLLDAVGSVSKILFGTMDADDQKLIDEQLQTLRTNGKVLQHAVANQIKVINATIAHLDELENTLNYNENLIMSATKRLEQRLTESTLQADVDEHFINPDNDNERFNEGHGKCNRLPDIREKRNDTDTTTTHQTYNNSPQRSGYTITNGITLSF
ncbi:uncharacterized protein LOC112553060 [Pogonomyrmex barbatus]|uniref:Uncharacterized protein LOC112553060 n=1 Tax=Pogonomyrmex barbatus TaxID=144034 RepID=A0A8N1SCD6_9HYME|nr:uncharacterized protein LOC112553060 [Pogonomyrmex barbatus]